jgi:BlaI family transcriptional regulator, penicillinase repressor
MSFYDGGNEKHGWSGKAAVRHHTLSGESLDVMQEVWAGGEATVDEIWRGLNARRRRTVRRTTVQVQMRRLEEYGWLSRRKTGRAFVYRPLWSRDETAADLVRSLCRGLYGGSLAGLLEALFRTWELSLSERRRIRALLRRTAGPDRAALAGDPSGRKPA